MGPVSNSVLPLQCRIAYMEMEPWEAPFHPAHLLWQQKAVFLCPYSLCCPLATVPVGYLVALGSHFTGASLSYQEASLEGGRSGKQLPLCMWLQWQNLVAVVSQTPTILTGLEKQASERLCKVGPSLLFS